MSLMEGLSYGYTHVSNLHSRETNMQGKVKFGCKFEGYKRGTHWNVKFKNQQ